MYCYVKMKSKCDVYSVYLATRTQDFSVWSSISCKDYRTGVQVAVCFPEVEPFCFLCHWLSSSVPVAVAHYLFIGCLVWKTSSLFNIDNKSEQRVCPSRYTGYHLCLLSSWLVFIVLDYPQSLRNLTVGCYFPILINTCQIFCPASLYSRQLLGQILVLITESSEGKLRHWHSQLLFSVGNRCWLTECWLLKS